MDVSLASLQRTQVSFKHDLYRRFSTALKEITDGNYVLIDVLDCYAKLPKQQHAVAGSHQLLVNDSATIVSQRDALEERVSANRLTVAPQPSNIPLAPAEEATGEAFTQKFTRKTAWVLHRISNRCLHLDGGSKFQIDWEGQYKTTWGPRSNFQEEAISSRLTQYHKNCY